MPRCRPRVSLGGRLRGGPRVGLGGKHRGTPIGGMPRDEPRGRPRVGLGVSLEVGLRYSGRPSETA
eukprot:2332494-Pyramimonas_sp.AAC.1